MKTCAFCNGEIAEWAQDHGMDNCAHNLKEINTELLAALTACAISLEYGDSTHLEVYKQAKEAIVRAGGVK